MRPGESENHPAPQNQHVLAFSVALKRQVIGVECPAVDFKAEFFGGKGEIKFSDHAAVRVGKGVVADPIALSVEFHECEHPTLSLGPCSFLEPTAQAP